MTVAFNNIPANLRIPLFWAEFDNSQAGQNQSNSRTLIIGQTLVAQNPALTYVNGAADAKSLFGRGSMLARMVAAYRANDGFGELWALPLADATGSAAAVGSLVITGTATQTGTLPLYIGGQSIPVGVTSGDTAATIASNVSAAMASLPDLAATAAVTGGGSTVTITAKAKGLVGNSLTISLAPNGLKGGEIIPAGLACAITAFTGGSGEPDLTGVAAILGDELFDVIVCPYTSSASLTALKALMSDAAGRWAWSSQVFGGVFCARRTVGSTLSNQVQDADTFGTTVAKDDQHVVVWNYEAAALTPADEAAAMWGGQCSPSLEADPNRPLQTLQLVGFVSPSVGYRFQKTDQQALLTSGVALSTYDNQGNAYILRSVTTYISNVYGQPDQSYLDCETLYTYMAMIRYLKGRITQKYPRHKLAQDGTKFGEGQPIITPKIARAELIAAYNDLCLKGLCQDVKAFAKGLIVEIDADDASRLNVLIDPYFVSGLRIFAVKTQFHLQAPAA